MQTLVLLLWRLGSLTTYGCGSMTASRVKLDLSRWASLSVFRAWSDSDLFRRVTVRPYGAVAWGEGDDIEICQYSLYMELTGKTLEEMYPKPWQPLPA